MIRVAIEVMVNDVNEVKDVIRSLLNRAAQHGTTPCAFHLSSSNSEAEGLIVVEANKRSELDLDKLKSTKKSSEMIEIPRHLTYN